MVHLLDFLRRAICPKVDNTFYIDRIKNLSNALIATKQTIDLEDGFKVEPRKIVQNIVTADLTYIAYEVAEWERILSDLTVKGDFEYRKSIFDCDDFALVCASTIAQSAYHANLEYQPAFCIMWSRTHAYNGFITDAREVYVYEPQTNEIMGKLGDDMGENYATTKIWIMS